MAQSAIFGYENVAYGATIICQTNDTKQRRYYRAISFDGWFVSGKSAARNYLTAAVSSNQSAQRSDQRLSECATGN